MEFNNNGANIEFFYFFYQHGAAKIDERKANSK